MKTNDRKITDLMSTIHTGKTQLPDFQRGWVWDDSRIKALIASITNGYPVGAAMFLEYGNESIHFKSRVVEGAPSADKVTPDELILDGQQRLTSVYSSLFSEKAVRTKTDKGQEIERFYYIDMVKAVNSTIDRVDSVVSVPKDRKITSDFGRKIELDLSSVSQEYAQNMFPLNIILDPSKYSKWQMDYMQYHQYDPNAAKLYMDFLSKVIVPLGQYTIPVITLDKDTPKEAVCQVFENVNTGGVSLTVFELVTAIFAMDNFELRKDWEERQKKYDFSEAYYDSYVCMAVKKGSSIKGYEDLKGKKVAAKTGTQGADCAESLKDKYGFDITYFDDSATMYQDVKTGNTVACFEDQPVMAYGVSQGNGLEIVAEEKDNFSTPYGFAVLKGQNADLLKMFNEGLKNIKANGTYDEIVAKYTSAK